MSLGKRFSKLLEKLEMTQTGLARALGTSNVVINRYVRDKTMPDYNFLKKLGNTYQVNINWLLTGEGPIFTGDSIKQIANKNYYNLPVLAAVSCGSPEDMAMADPEDYILIDSRSLPGDFSNYFAFTANGESMAPYISHGDVVVVKRQENWETADGRICVVWIDGEVTLKKITLFSEGREILLSPFNKDFSPLLIDPDSVDTIRLIGVAVMAVKNL